ncbi:MAG TPA: hypothetical protein VGW35_10340 [Methylomirabilota bacterium]|jgi:hypothetical protein|nr:hypothetical protein [Methylomirabilota bacterium]
MRTQNQWRPVLIAVLAWVLLSGFGCEEKTASILTRGNVLAAFALLVGADPIVFEAVPDIPNGVTLPVMELSYPTRSGLVPGRIQFSGQFVRIFPGSSLPPTLRITVRRLAATGAVLQTQQFSVRVVPSTGAIPLQTFPFAQIVVNPTERVVIAMQPLGARLDRSRLTFAWTYTRS